MKKLQCNSIWSYKHSASQSNLEVQLLKKNIPVKAKCMLYTVVGVYSYLCWKEPHDNSQMYHHFSQLCGIICKLQKSSHQVFGSNDFDFIVMIESCFPPLTSLSQLAAVGTHGLTAGGFAAHFHSQLVRAVSAWPAAVQQIPASFHTSPQC